MLIVIVLALNFAAEALAGKLDKKLRGAKDGKKETETACFGQNISVKNADLWYGDFQAIKT